MIEGRVILITPLRDPWLPCPRFLESGTPQLIAGCVTAITFVPLYHILPRGSDA
jgi:hypothetical protein